MTDNQLIADAKEAGFSIEENVIEVNCDWSKTWDITYEITAFAAIRDKRKDAEIAMLREALQALWDVQNGCPLPKYEADYAIARNLTINALAQGEQK